MGAKIGPKPEFQIYAHGHENKRLR